MISSYDVFNFFVLATAILSLLLSFFVFLNNRRSKLNILWGLVSLETAIWSFGLYQVINVDSEVDAIWWNKVLYLGAIFIPVLYYHFVTVLVGTSKKVKFRILFFYLVSFFFLFLNFTSPQFIKGAPPALGFKHWIQGGYFYYPFVVFFVSVVALSFAEALINLKNLSGFKKYQLKLVLFAGFIGFLGGSTAFLPQLFGFYPFGNFFVCFYVAVIGYAITRYRLMGIKVIINNILFFVILLLFVVGANYLNIFVHNYFFGLFGGNDYSLWINFSVAFVIVLFFIPFYHYAKNFSEVLVYHHHDPRRSVQNSAIKLYHQLNYEDLAREAVMLFRQVLDTERVAVLRYDFTQNKKIKLVNHEVFNDFLSRIDISFFTAFLKHNRLVSRDEICLSDFPKDFTEEQSALLCRLNVDLILPVRVEENFDLLFLIGAKIGGGFYSREDFEFIEKIQSHLARALANAVRLKKFSDRNKELEETHEQFLVLASDNLRVPASQIEGVAKLAIKEPETMTSRFVVCQNYARKINEVVDNLLLSARVKDGRLRIETQPTNLTKVLAEAVSKKEPLARDKNLELKIKVLAEQDIYVESERAILEQLLLGLIDNAINFTAIGSVTLKLEKIDKYAMIKIIDTGSGIDRRDRRKLFQKFFKGRNNYSREGLGLGLYTAKKIIEAHSGAKIDIDDSPGARGAKVTLKFLSIEKPNFS